MLVDLCGRRRLAREDGDIIASGLTSILLVLAVIGLIVYEVVAIGVAAVAADDAAMKVAREAASVYRQDTSLADARAAASAAGSAHDAENVTVEQVGDELVVTLHRRARTLLVHRLGPLEDLATPSAVGRVRWTTS